MAEIPLESPPDVHPVFSLEILLNVSLGIPLKDLVEVSSKIPLNFVTISSGNSPSSSSKSGYFQDFRPQVSLRTSLKVRPEVSQ